MRLEPSATSFPPSLPPPLRTARAIHHASGRGQYAFIHVYCAMLAPGQDPGLVSPPRGSSEAGAGPALTLLELATRGTLYLEQVDRLAAELQERLAEVLESVEAVRFIVYSSLPLTTPGRFHPRLLSLLERRQPGFEPVDSLQLTAERQFAEYAYFGVGHPVPAMT